MVSPIKAIIVIILSIAILFGFGLLMSRPPNDNVQEMTSTARGESKSDNGEGGVTVMAEFAESNGQFVFDVALDTHFVDLSSLNPKAQFSLENEEGKSIAVERAQSSGSEHHQEITLYFPKIQGTVRLVARDIAGVPRREIIWPR